MKLLLDSHTLIWAVDEPARLSPTAPTLLQDPANQLLLSAASVWETAIKVGLKKLDLTLRYQQWMSQAIADLEHSLLPVTVEYANMQVGLPDHHRDPFDRLIISQALAEGVSVVGSDPIFDRYGIVRLW